jgi:hypothetical protein
MQGDASARPFVEIRSRFPQARERTSSARAAARRRRARAAETCAAGVACVFVAREERTCGVPVSSHVRPTDPRPPPPPLDSADARAPRTGVRVSDAPRCGMNSLRGATGRSTARTPVSMHTQFLSAPQGRRSHKTNEKNGGRKRALLHNPRSRTRAPHQASSGELSSPSANTGLASSFGPVACANCECRGTCVGGVGDAGSGEPNAPVGDAAAAAAAAAASASMAPAPAARPRRQRRGELPRRALASSLSAVQTPLRAHATASGKGGGGSGDVARWWRPGLFLV